MFGSIHKELLIAVNLRSKTSTIHFIPFCVSLYWFYVNKKNTKTKQKQYGN